jgi:L-arabinokinase
LLIQPGVQQSAIAPVPSIFFYVSGHGFGHASRQIEVMNAVGRLLPSYTIVIRTSASRWLFDHTMRAPFTWLEGPADTGIVQIDSLRLDERETIRQAERFYRDFGVRRDLEAALLGEHNARFVVSDAPPLACAAAAWLGIPCTVVANFTWDWIYEGYPEHLAEAPDLIPTIRGAYSQADEAWRLPMHGGFAAFDRIIDVPFIGRRATRDRTDVRRILGLPADRRLALSSFGGYGLGTLDHAGFDCLDRFGIVITGHREPESVPRGVHFINERAIFDAGLRYEDLVGAVDVVVSKPGFGIIAECVTNDTPMLYTSRGRFVEYDVLVAEMPRVLRCGFLDEPSLRAGRWREALERVLALPAPPETPATDGAEVVARMIADRL